MNLPGIMQQAQKMQKKLQDAKTELENTEIKGVSGNGAVEIICNGQGIFKSIKLKPEAINPENPSAVDNDTLEMLEDLITQAITSATQEAVTKMEAKMKSITGGINIPNLF